MNKTLVVLLTGIFLSPIFSLFSPSPIRADWLIDRSGAIVQIDPRVLGDDVDNSGSSTDQSSVDDDVSDDVDESPSPSTSPTSTSPEQNLQIQRSREIENQRLEKSRETLKKQIESRQKIQEKKGDKSETELRTTDGKFKLKQEVKDVNGRLIKKQEIEVNEGESVHVEQEGEEPITINAVKDGRLELIKNKIKTNSDLDLKVGDKNEISVTLTNGKTKEIALPDQALERLIANGVIAQLESGAESEYELIAGKNGDPVYEVKGRVEKKLFGLFKLKFTHKLEVAAGASEDGTIEVGDIVDSESSETGWRRLWERLAI